MFSIIKNILQFAAQDQGHVRRGALFGSHRGHGGQTLFGLLHMAGHEAAFKATAAAQGRHDGREVAVGLEDDGGIGLFQRPGQALFVPDTGDDAQGLVAFAQNGAGTRGRRLERGDARYDLHRQGIIQLPERFQQVAERAVDQRVADGQEGRVLAAPQHVACDARRFFPGRAQGGPVVRHGEFQPLQAHVRPQMGTGRLQRPRIVVARRGRRQDHVHPAQGLHGTQGQQIGSAGAHTHSVQGSCHGHLESLRAHARLQTVSFFPPQGKRG